MEKVDQKIARQLKVICSPQEYQIGTAPQRLHKVYNSLDYWRCIPTYRVTRCPICQHTYDAQVDTYCLQYTIGSNNGWGEAITAKEREPMHCPHYVAVQTFINLHGGKPSELSSRTFFAPEIPSVQKHLLPQDVVSYAVLHALPIARIEDGHFVPRYTMYLMAYFSENPSELIRRFSMEVGQIQRTRDPEYHASLLSNPSPHDEEAYDLVRWIERGRLKWLDLDQDDLPLISSPVDHFPYAHVNGKRCGFDYRKGHIQDRWGF